MILAFLTILVSAQYTNIHYEPLANVRSKLVFREHSPKERQVMVDSAINLFSVYVNKKVKEADFGVDPMPALMALKQTAGNMTQEQINRNLSSIFQSIRDLHTNYRLQGPYNCFTAYSGLTLTMADPNSTIVFTKTNGNPNITTLNQQVFDQIQRGDILLRVNNQTFEEFARDHPFGGANPMATKRRAMDSLIKMPGSRYFLPEQDFLDLDLLRDNQIINLKVPWIVGYDPQCYLDGLTTQRIKTSFVNEIHNIQPQNWFGEPFDQFDSELFEGFTKASPTFSWKIHGQLGIIRLTGFVDEYQDIGEVLKVQMNSTDALLFDLRGNGGGDGGSIRHYINLFSDTFSSFYLRAAKTKMNNVIFNRLSMENSFYKDYQAYFSNATDDFYSNTRIFDDLSQAPEAKRVYFKPVGILTDAKCFSACDVFAAVAQDDKTAIIFGEDDTTGAGGANVVTTAFFEKVAPDYFKQDVLSASVSWRQVVRKDEHIIEDVGVKTDVYVRPSIQDIKNGTNYQYDRILQVLTQSR